MSYRWFTITEESKTDSLTEESYTEPMYLDSYDVDGWLGTNNPSYNDKLIRVYATTSVLDNIQAESESTHVPDSDLPTPWEDRTGKKKDKNTLLEEVVMSK